MSQFRVVEHTCPAQHIREYPQAISTHQEDVLHLVAKQYIPLKRQSEQGITILAAHANGFPKELYEPLWDDLLRQSESAGFSIRSIWMVDAAHEGASYVLNESKTGNDPNFFDYSRDLLTLVNHFRSEFPRPIVGVGHSMGGTALCGLAFVHPRLLSSIIFVDPIIPSGTPANMYQMPKPTTFRRDKWKTRAEAEAGFRKSPLTRTFDERVVRNIVDFSIRPTPTLLHPDDEEGLTLTTPKHQESFSFVRANYADHGVEVESNLLENPEHLTLSDTHEIVPQPPVKQNRASHPDVWSDSEFRSPFYKSEGRTCFKLLPFLRPSALFLYGGESASALPEERRAKMESTGTGWNGSGGVAAGRVQEAVVAKAGHFLCFEKDKVGQCAAIMAGWLAQEGVAWREDEQRSVCPEWSKKDVREKQMMDERWLKEIKGWSGQRKVSSKL